MSRERGQALVEAVVALPVSLACALALVDCGIIVRDRMVATQAATRAAEAHLSGRDEQAAARSAVPDSLRTGLSVTVANERVTVRLESRAAIARLAGRPVEHRSIVRLDTVEVTR